jgi:hypothetical protein
VFEARPHDRQAAWFEPKEDTLAEEASSASLTDAEMQVIDRIGDAYRAFAALDAYHPSDHDEFVFHVHAMGRIVLARLASRAHPERGWIKAGPGKTTPEAG